MNILLTACDLRLGINPMVFRTLQEIPGIHLQTTISPNTDAVFLSWIAAPEIFQQDTAMLRAIVDSKKPVIIFDHMEIAQPNCILGKYVAGSQMGSYSELFSAASKMNVKAYFKRELIAGETIVGPFEFPVYPLDWTLQTNGTRHIPVSRESYEARPIDIFYSWGYSSESRPRLMGELLKQAGRFCAHFCLTEEDLDIALKEKRERIFALLHTPHYRRIHISKLMEWQQQSKISISMFGAGKKCFRHAEASFNSVMGQQSPGDVVWSYPWISGENCLGVPDDEDESSDFLYQCLRINQGGLYPIYLAGAKNNENYHTNHYARNYLLPKIKEALK